MSEELWTDRDDPDGIYIVPAAFQPHEGEDVPTICFIPHSDRSERDARLILAVPALLAACRADHAFQQHFSTCRNCRPLCEKGNDLRVEANRLRALAMKEAEG